MEKKNYIDHGGGNRKTEFRDDFQSAGSREEKRWILDERYRQIRGVIIETAERVAKDNPGIEEDEFYREILGEMNKVGAYPSEEQRTQLESRLLSFVQDIRNYKKEVRQLARDSGVTILRQFKDHPWLMFNRSPSLRKEFLKHFASLKKRKSDPSQFLFIVDKPPFILIACEDEKDFFRLGGFSAKKHKNLGGLALSGQNMTDIESFDGKIGLVKGIESLEVAGVVTHELQHLMFARYLLGNESLGEKRALDELAAYAKEYRFQLDEKWIFSDLPDKEAKSVSTRFMPGWRDVKFEIARLRLAGASARELFDIFNTSDTLSILAERLRKVRTESKYLDYDRFSKDEFLRSLGTPFFLELMARNLDDFPIGTTLEKIEVDRALVSSRGEDISQGIEKFTFDLHDVRDSRDGNLIQSVIFSFRKFIQGLIFYLNQNDPLGEHLVRDWDSIKMPIFLEWKKIIQELQRQSSNYNYAVAEKYIYDWEKKTPFTLGDLYDALSFMDGLSAALSRAEVK